MWIYLLCQAEASLKTKPAFIITTPTAWHLAAAGGWGGGARWTAGQLFLDPAPRMRKALQRPVSPSPQESTAVCISMFLLFFFFKCFLYFFFLKPYFLFTYLYFGHTAWHGGWFPEQGSNPGLRSESTES